MPSLHMDPPKKSLSQMKHDRKCSSRRLTREVSMLSNSSVEELYEGKSAAIPFTWESQPGTPKIKFREAPLPPLTPPPSYYYKSTSKRSINKHSKPSFLNNIFARRNSRNVSSSSGSSSSSSSPTSSFSSSPSPSSYSVPSSPMTPSRFCRRGGRISSPRMSYDCSAGDGDNEYRETISTLCFGVNPWSKIIGSKAVIRV